MQNFIIPKWPAPTWVRAYSTTRPLNLGTHIDSPQGLAINRLKLQQRLNLAIAPLWLDQIHGDTLINLDDNLLSHPRTQIIADGIWTQKVGAPCLVLTGDCLPILLCDAEGSVVCALHCGWRGLTTDLIEKAVRTLREKTAAPLLAWLGPAISQDNYEVGEEVRQRFLKQNPLNQYAFKPSINPGKWMASLSQLGTNALKATGVTAIYGGDYCTFDEANNFYSARREGVKSGRMGTLIYLSPS